eukprot:jgi/Tetstr1/436442/TSEL_025271.t1
MLTAFDGRTQVQGKLMKDSKTRILTLHCLQGCTQAYLERYGGVHSDKQMSEWLTKCLKSPMALVCKGSLSLEQKPGQDLGATMLKICQIVAAKAPHFTIKGLILELLQSDVFSCQHIGLQALLNMVLSAPMVHSARSPGVTYPGSSPSQQVMELMRGGTSPLELLGVGPLSAPIGEAVGKVLNHCQVLFGGLQLSNVQRNVLDQVPKEKIAGLTVLRVALLCIPYVPSGRTAWSQAEMLASYTKHAHQDVRQQAHRALFRTLRCQPAMRALIVEAMAKGIATTSDEHPQVIESGLCLLIDICLEWVSLLQATPPTAAAGICGAEDLESDVHLNQLEGLGLIYLANNEPSIRVHAVELLKRAQLLHRTMAVAKHSAGRPSDLYGTTYAIDIIEQDGDEIAQLCYWDFGRFSDLWRMWRSVPPEVQPGLWPLLSSGNKGLHDTGNDPVRWARFLSEIVRRISILCPKSVTFAYEEISSRCHRMMHSQESGQMVFRGNQQGATDTPRSGIGLESMLQLVIRSIRHQQELHFTGFMSLGQCHHDRSEFLLDELKKTLATAEDRSKTKAKVTPGELRVVFAHVVRLMAHNISAARLVEDNRLMQCYLDFILSTADYCQRSNEFMYWDCQPLRYCCCSVTSALAEPMMLSGVLSLAQRKSLFSVFEAWHVRAREIMREVQTSKDVMGGSRELQAVLSKLKDAETMKNVRTDMVEQCEGLQTAALCARAALLAGESLDGDSRLQGNVGNWVHSMFSSKTQSASVGPSLQQVAHIALLNLLKTNLDLLPAVIDRCYLKDAGVSNFYFHVMAEVYTREAKLHAATHILLSLVLYKMVDPSPEVRDDALTVLDVLVERMWTSGVRKRHIGTAVVGGLQDSYQEFQCQLSTQMAMDHPELSQNLCIEMLTRVLDVADKVTRHQILICLPPWMQNLSFSGRESSSNAVLKSLYYVTWQHGAQFPYELEKLWSTLAGNRRNIIPILDFLICKGVEEGAPGDLQAVTTYFSVAKRITLYVARIASQQTVDHLVYEMTQQLYEEDDTYKSTGSACHQVFFSKRLDEDEAGDGAHYAIYNDMPNDEPLTAPLPPAHASWLRLSMTSGNSASLGRGPGLPHAATQTAAVMRGLAQQSAVRTLSAPSSILEMASDFGAADSLLPTAGGADGTLTRPLTRAELSLCLLAEVAYEHDEDFRSHLPLLFHMSLICMDASEPTVSHHCALLAVNLLYSLGIRHLESGTGGLSRTATTLSRVSSTIKQLQSMAGQRLWAYEDTSLDQPRLKSFDTMQALVNSVLEAIVFESDLRDRWGEEALKWAVECSSRHLSGRSLQVFRALSLPLSSHGAACMLYCLHMVLKRAASNSEDVTALNCAMEILLSLQLLVDATPASKIILYPQLFWACISLLPLPQPQLYKEVLGLLCRLLEKMNLNQVSVQNTLVASAPGSQAWELELSLTQSPPASLHSSLMNSRVAESGNSGIDAPARNWGEVLSWKAGEHLLNGAASPTSLADKGSWPTVALQQLLVKGLLDPDCCSASVHVMMHVLTAMAGVALPTSSDAGASLHLPVNSVSSCSQMMIAMGPNAMRSHTTGIGVILGPPDTQLLISVLSLLPWMYVHHGSLTHADATASCAALLATASRSQGYDELGSALAGILAKAPPSCGAEDFVAQLSEPLVFTFFPRYGKLFCQLMMCMISVGPSSYHAVCLALLRSVLMVPKVRLGSAEAWLTSPGSFTAVADIVSQGGSSGSPLAAQALGLLDVVMQRFPSDVSQGATPIMEHWKVKGCRMIVNGGEQAEAAATQGSTAAGREAAAEGAGTAVMLQPEDGLSMCCAALEGVLGTCHKAHAGRASKRGFMPFCQTTAG